MSSARWQAAWEIFEAARELPAEQQREFVEFRSGNPELACQVFELLESLAEEESHPVEELASSRTGTQVGKYRIEGLLGRGGMGEVYAARDTDLDRLTALKFLRPESIGDPAAVERFVREARAASALNHPNIVTIHEVIGDSVAGLAIAMELVDGESLRRLRADGQTVSWVIRVGEQIARALAAAHEAGLMHRDIKPENILVRRDGYVKLVDFGLAQRVAVGGDGVVVGTVRYMSPEHLRGETTSAASDIYSLGLVLRELITGSAELDGLIGRMVAPDAGARPSAAEVARTLAELERAPGVRAARRRAGTWAVAAVVLVAGSFGVWAWSRPGTAAKEPSFRQVTTLAVENRATAAAIAPGGKWTAYANVDGVFVRPTETDTPKRLQSPAGLLVDRLVWSGNETNLLASGFSTVGNEPEVWVISVKGEAPRKVRMGARHASWSPDETKISFIRADRSEIWTMAADGTGARRVLGGPEELFLLVFWSPDGKRLAYQRRRVSAETDPPNVETDAEYVWRYEVADAGTGRVLAKAPGMPMGTATPLPDGRILFVRVDHAYLNSGRAVWEVRTEATTGAFAEQPRRIAEMPESGAALLSLSATADGKRILAIKRSDQTTVFAADFAQGPPRLANIHRIVFDEKVNYPHAWTPDSRAVIFESNRNGNYDLFRQNLGQRTAETIVATKQDEVLEQLAPDGRTVLYALRPDPAKRREFELMRVPLAGGTPEAVPIGGLLDEFRCAVGGKRCVLRTTVAGQYFAFHELDAVRGKGRELARVAWRRNVLGDWDLSPDGQRVAIPNHYSRDARIRVVSLNGDAERELLLPGLRDLQGLVWAADGSGWFVLADMEVGLQQFFVFPDGRYQLLGDIRGWMVPAPDGRQLAFMNRNVASNAWVVDRE